MIKLLGIVSVLSFGALAVTTKDCPKQLEVKVSNLNVTRTEAYVQNEVKFVTENKREAIAEAYHDMRENDGFELALPLSVARNGICRYQAKGSDDQIELYSRKGVDRLVAESDTGKMGILIRVYAEVDSISPEEVELSDAGKGLALAIPRGPYKDYSVGGPLVFVGNAKSVTTSVE